jgi:hypothetical protein
VAWSRSSLRGVVLADAGTGINGVLVHVAGADRRTTTLTADDGTFVVEGLAPGDYDVTIDAGSVPAGYPVDNLAAQRVRVENMEPGRARFVLRPYRSVAGRARMFDRERGQYVPLAGATVELLPLGRKSVTDAEGQYAFRNLPAGRYTIVARRDGRENTTAVSLPEGPAIVRDVELAMLAVGEVAARGSSLGAGNAEQPPSPAQLLEGLIQTIGLSSGNTAGSAATSGVFTIEVAESSNARHARTMVDELKDAGHDAYLEKAVPGKHGTYRVRVGHYSGLADAKRSARTLERALGWQMSVTAVASEPVARGNAASYNH